jgi:hypothetical protein
MMQLEQKCLWFRHRRNIEHRLPKKQNNVARGADATIKIIGDIDLLSPAKILKYRSLKRPVREKEGGKRSRTQLVCPDNFIKTPLYTFNKISQRALTARPHTAVFSSHRPVQIFSLILGR